jgi:uncharacterized protein DUF3606
MSDDLKNPGPEDGLRINLHQEHEVRYWCKALDCEEFELRACVEKVGMMADDVRACIENEKMDTQR